MTKHTPWPTHKSPTVGTTAEDLRKDLAGSLTLNSGNPSDVRLGVWRDSDTPVVSGTAGPNYSVRAFAAVLAGPVLVASSATEVVVPEITTPPSSGSRIEIVWCRATRISGDGASDDHPGLIFGVAQGGAGSSPSAPTIPSGALELARAEITSETTATNSVPIGQTHPWTVARGAAIPVRSLADRNTITPVIGTRVVRLDNGGNMQRYDAAGVWVDDGAGPVASVSRTSSDGIEGPGLLTIAMNAVDFDPAGMWSASAPERLTAKVAGVYRVHASGGWNEATLTAGAQISVNGLAVRLGTTEASSQQVAQVERLVRLEVGDYVSMQLYQERTAGNTILTFTDRKPSLTAEWRAP